MPICDLDYRTENNSKKIYNFFQGHRELYWRRGMKESKQAACADSQKKKLFARKKRKKEKLNGFYIQPIKSVPTKMVEKL